MYDIYRFIWFIYTNVAVYSKLTTRFTVENINHRIQMKKEQRK